MGAWGRCPEQVGQRCVREMFDHVVTGGISQRKVGMGICPGSHVCPLEAVEYSAVVLLLIKYCMMVYWPSFSFNR